METAIYRFPQAYYFRHHRLDLEVVLDDRQINLVQEGIDVALRMGKLMDSALTARRIARCKRLVLGTPAYFDRAGTPSTPSELSKHQAVVYLQREGSVWSFRRETSGGCDRSKQIAGHRCGRRESCGARGCRPHHRVGVDVQP